MKRILITTFSFSLVLSLFALGGKSFSRHNTVRAQAEQAQAENYSHRSRCSNRTGSGTYGYRMRGSIVGVGPFLVNGIFTTTPEGTSSAKVRVTINGQTIPTTGTNGKFTTNDDCTGSGTFFIPELNQQITYNSILTDGGDQITLLNTNPGIVLQGYGRRIAPAGRAPRCDNRMVAGDYGYWLEGSLPGVPNVAAAGFITQTLSGRIFGFDALALNGGQLPRRDYEGTYTLNRDCTGTGTYKDSLGSKVNFVFTVVGGGNEIYLQGANGDGDNITGVARRVR